MRNLAPELRLSNVVTLSIIGSHSAMEPRKFSISLLQVLARTLRTLGSAERGYALPSLLLLVVVLSLLASAVLTHNYLQRQLALKSVFSVKAEYAAQSAIARTVASLKSAQDYNNRLSQPPTQIAFEDGSQATVQLERWGCYGLIRSRGTCKQARAERTAVVAQRAGPSFDQALVFANTGHQLVLTGSSAVKGTIVVGPPGVATGTLIGQPSMRLSLPIANIHREPVPKLASFDRKALTDEIESYERMLSGEFRVGSSGEDHIAFSSAPSSLIEGEKIPSGVRSILVERDAILTGAFKQREIPLFIIVHGAVSFRRTVQLSGPIAVLARGAVTVPKDVQIDCAIIYSATRVEVEPSASLSAQIFSPFILLRSGATALYPSLLVSTSRPAAGSAQAGILMEGNAVLQGTILSLTPKSGSQIPLIVIQPGATVTGAVYSENEITLDGSVNGTVMAKDFYFYVPPTTYRGWLRSAQIDRHARPQGFLLPIGFAESFQLDILEWL
jgi:hypothetical protein